VGIDASNSFKRKIRELEARLAAANAEVDVARRFIDALDLSEAERQRARSERRFRALAEHSSDAIHLLDPAGVVLYAGGATHKVLGLRTHELIGRRLHSIVDDVDGASLDAALRECAARPGAPITRELRLAGGDGGARTVEAVVASHLHDPDVAAIVATCRDVTARRAFEADLLQTQKMEAVGRLAGGIAHDFNNLLSAILGFAKLAKDGLPAADPVRDDMDGIIAAADRAAQLTRQLLSFSRKQHLEPRVIDPSAHIAGFERILRRVIPEHVVLDLRLSPRVPPIKVDPTHFEQALINLVINARDAMLTGGALTIETGRVVLEEAAVRRARRLRPGRFVVVTVRDTGTGMSDEVRERIFEPFFTTKPREQGTGLGLAMVLGFVEQSGGQIDVETSPGAGTAMRLYFPPSDEQPAPADTLRPAGVKTGSETVLVVDDNDAVRQVLRAALLRLGYSVLEAHHPGEALLVAEQHAGPIDLLITDVVMPRMSGPTLADRLGRQRPDLRVLFISGYAHGEFGPCGPAAPTRDVLVKPFTPQALASKVRELLDRG
jgi:PAS domain S-box-containing protein